MAAKKQVARRPMGYGHLTLDRGQVFELTGARNDEKLSRLGYCMDLPARSTTYACAECGAEFVGEAERRGHGDKRHRTRILTPLEEDLALDREVRMLEQIAPLNLDQTAAVRA